MKQYEYKIVNTRGEGVPLGEGDDYWERLENGLNELGGQGWELAYADAGKMIFVREKGGSEAMIIIKLEKDLVIAGVKDGR